MWASLPVHISFKRMHTHTHTHTHTLWQLMESSQHTKGLILLARTTYEPQVPRQFTLRGPSTSTHRNNTKPSRWHREHLRNSWASSLVSIPLKIKRGTASCPPLQSMLWTLNLRGLFEPWCWWYVTTIVTSCKSPKCIYIELDTLPSYALLFKCMGDRLHEVD